MLVHKLYIMDLETVEIESYALDGVFSELSFEMQVRQCNRMKKKYIRWKIMPAEPPSYWQYIAAYPQAWAARGLLGAVPWIGGKSTR